MLWNSPRCRSSLGPLASQRGEFGGGISCYEIPLDVALVWGHYPVSVENSKLGISYYEIPLDVALARGHYPVSVENSRGHFMLWNSPRCRSSLGPLASQRGEFGGGISCYEIPLDVALVWGHYPVSVENSKLGISYYEIPLDVALVWGHSEPWIMHLRHSESGQWGSSISSVKLNVRHFRSSSRKMPGCCMDVCGVVRIMLGRAFVYLLFQQRT